VGAITTIGGQAVPDGVMLRGPGGWAVAVRRDDGEIAVASYPNIRRPRRVWSRPFVRGLHSLATALPLGMRSMSVADQMRHASPRPRPTVRQRVWFAVSLAAAVAFAALLFGMVPTWAGSWLSRHAHMGHAAEPAVRTALIVAYVAAVGMLADVRRVFAYHGAEHQVVAAHEFGTHVDAASARSFSRFHPRCGTTFVLLVALMDGVLRAVMPLPSGALFRAVQVPLAITIAYELLQVAVGSPRRPWSRLILAPGRALQRLTTRAPDHGQLEVACAALGAVLRLEDQDQQQDDQDQDENASADVHGPSSERTTIPFSEAAASETSA
jgi:uncharacterized protein YqhQ